MTNYNKIEILKMSNKNSDIEILAKTISDFYRIGQINTIKTGNCPSCLSEYGIIHEDVSDLLGYKSIQMILNSAYNYYNKADPVTNKSGEEEKKKYKALIPQLSVSVDKLYNLSNREPENHQLYEEYKQKKATLDEYLEKYGKILGNKSEISNDNAKKITDIKKAYKILIGYYDPYKKKRAIDFYNMIKKNVIPDVKTNYTQHYNPNKIYKNDYTAIFNEPSPIVTSSINNDGWTTVPSKKRTNNTLTQTNTNKVSLTPDKLEEFIDHYITKSYVPPMYRKIVEDEIANRKEREKNAFPELGNIIHMVDKNKYSGPSFKDIITSTKISTICPSDNISIKKNGLQELERPICQKELISKIDNGCLTTYIYNEIDNKGNQKCSKYNVQNKVFHENLRQLNQEHRLNRDYYSDRKRNKCYNNMTFNEWILFQKEIEEQLENNRHNDMEKYKWKVSIEEYNEDDYIESYDEEFESSDPEFEFKKEFTEEIY